MGHSIKCKASDDVTDNVPGRLLWREHSLSDPRIFDEMLRDEMTVAVNPFKKGERVIRLHQWRVH